MDANTKFVKCKNCGNYFVPVGRSDSVYCGYPSPQDETKECRDVGANATRVKKMKNDVLTKEYRRLYMRLKMALKRHPDDVALRERLMELTEGMKIRKRQKEEGTISADGILEWLISFDNHLNEERKWGFYVPRWYFVYLCIAMLLHGFTKSVMLLWYHQMKGVHYHVGC